MLDKNMLTKTARCISLIVSVSGPIQHPLLSSQQTPDFPLHTLVDVWMALSCQDISNSVIRDLNTHQLPFPLHMLYILDSSFFVEGLDSSDH